MLSILFQWLLLASRLWSYSLPNVGSSRHVDNGRTCSRSAGCWGRQTNADSLDRVSNVFVDTAFRSTPWAQEARESGSGRTAARILIVSESGVCRSVLAEALLRQALSARGLSGQVECEARGTRRAPAAVYLAVFSHS